MGALEWMDPLQLSKGKRGRERRRRWNKKFPLVSANSSKSNATDKQFYFCSCMSSYGTYLAKTCLIPISLV